MASGGKSRNGSVFLLDKNYNKDAEGSMSSAGQQSAGVDDMVWNLASRGGSRDDEEEQAQTDANSPQGDDIRSAHTSHSSALPKVFYWGKQHVYWYVLVSHCASRYFAVPLAVCTRMIAEARIRRKGARGLEPNISS